MAEYKFKLILLVVAYEACLTSVLAEAEVVEWVSRRLLGDLYSYIDRSGNKTINHEICQEESLTFLTGENQCVSEEDLFRDCNHTILASDSKLVAIANIDPNTLNITHLVLDNPNIAVEFHFNETGQALNNSFCHISRLEVFRGWNQTFQISHNGFSLGDDATVEINQAQLGYPLEDFEGELYCITISCTDPQLPRSGCLFFKVIGHQSNVTQAKFNCIVPGTLTNSSEECNITNSLTIGTITTSLSTTTTTASESTTAAIVSTASSTSHTTNSTAKSVTAPVDQPIRSEFYILIAIGAGIVILTVTITVLCSFITCKLVNHKSQSYDLETIQHNDNIVTEHPVLELENGHQQTPPDSEPGQIEGEATVLDPSANGNNIYTEQQNETNMLTSTNPHSNNTAAPQDWITDNETGHVYAVLEQTVSPQLSTTAKTVEKQSTNQMQSQNGAAARFHSVSDSRSLSNVSRPDKGLQHSLKDMLWQIYDEVNPKANGKAAEHESEYANVASIPKKISLPTYLGMREDEGGPIYSVPYVPKKREGRQIRKEQVEREDRLGRLRKISTTSCPPHLNIRGMQIRVAESANHTEKTHHNLNCCDDILLEEDYDSPDILNRVVQDAGDMDGPQYDNPTSLDIIPRRDTPDTPAEIREGVREGTLT